MLKEFFKIDELTDHVKEYINTRISILKLGIAEKISKVLALLIAGAIVFIILFFSFVFISFAAAHGVGEALGHTWLGFLIVSAGYLLLGMIIWKAKNRLIRIPIMNAIIRQLFSDEEKNTDHEKN